MYTFVDNYDYMSCSWQLPKQEICSSAKTCVNYYKYNYSAKCNFPMVVILKKYTNTMSTDCTCGLYIIIMTHCMHYHK